MTIGRRESLFVGLILFFALGTAFSAQASSGGPNPLSVLFLGLAIFAMCSIVLGTAKILLYHVWHKESCSRSKTLYFTSSAVEVASCLIIGFLFHFSEFVMFGVLSLYWILETLINPVLLRWISPARHANYWRDIPLSLSQGFAMPALGLFVYVICGFMQ